MRALRYVLLLFFVPSFGTAFAADFGYADFSDVSALSLTGTAARSGSHLRLTDSSNSQWGSAWHTAKVNVASGFQTTFQYTISNPQDDGADGMAFVIQNTSTSALGTGGGGIGYAGIPNSIAVEIDTYQGDSDPDANHVAIMTRGVNANSDDHSLAQVAVLSPNFTLEGTHTVQIKYGQGALNVVIDGASLFGAVIDLSTTLSLDSGTAWVGFTAATGGASEEHDVNWWTFSEGAVCGYYSDNFENGILPVGWDFPKPSWSENSGDLVGTSTKKALAIATPVISGPFGILNTTLQMGPEASGKASIFPWYVDQKTQIELQAVGKGRWILKRKENGVVLFKAKAKKAIVPGQVYAVRIVDDGTKVQVFVDDLVTPLITVPHNDLFPFGTIAFQVKGTSARFSRLCMDTTT